MRLSRGAVLAVALVVFLPMLEPASSPSVPVSHLKPTKFQTHWELLSESPTGVASTTTYNIRRGLLPGGTSKFDPAPTATLEVVARTTAIGATSGWWVELLNPSGTVMSSVPYGFANGDTSYKLKTQSLTWPSSNQELHRLRVRTEGTAPGVLDLRKAYIKLHQEGTIKKTVGRVPIGSRQNDINSQSWVDLTDIIYYKHVADDFDPAPSVRLAAAGVTPTNARGNVRLLAPDGTVVPSSEVVIPDTGGPASGQSGSFALSQNGSYKIQVRVEPVSFALTWKWDLHSAELVFEQSTSSQHGLKKAVGFYPSVTVPVTLSASGVDLDYLFKAPESNAHARIAVLHATMRRISGPSVGVRLRNRTLSADVQNLATTESASYVLVEASVPTPPPSGNTLDSRTFVPGGASGRVSASLYRVAYKLRDLGTPPSIDPPPHADGVATDFSDSVAFLYTGDSPVQEGVDPADIDPGRVSVVRGVVRDVNGDVLPNVLVSVVDHPEFGWTRSRDDGEFDLAVNGGELLTIEIEGDDLISVHRKVAPGWNEHAIAADAVAVPFDSEVTTVDLGAIPAGELAVARGSTVTDADGTRKATLLIPSGVEAELVFPDGTTQSVTSLSLRATELTVGEDGEDRMPAPLPPTSAYTYAVDLSADEVAANDASGVEFSEPVWHYVENFLGFPVGEPVPAGYYDYNKAAWVPSDSGIILEIISITGGKADVDVTGDGIADSGAALEEIGLTDAEREQLADLYEPGVSLWRVPIEHFSIWDFNWGFGIPLAAISPLFTVISDALQFLVPNCGASGSVIGCEAQSLSERVGLVGMGTDLVYSSLRAPGYRGRASLQMQVTPPEIPEELLRVDMRVDIAGRRFTESLDAVPDQVFTFDWDGFDVYGRRLNGEQPAFVSVGYVYAAAYASTGGFGNPSIDGNTFSVNLRRDEFTLWRSTTVMLGTALVADARGMGLGGWGLDVHHAYDPRARLLMMGDGSAIQIDPVYAILDTLVGDGATLDAPGGLATDAEGNLYLADTFNDKIRRRDADGTITTIGGTGTFGYSGDGGPATSADLASPLEIALDSAGNLYFADVDNHRIRRIAADGTISTIAGSGARGYSGDGGPAVEAKLNEPTGVAVASDGTVYVADYANHRVRRVSLDGRITTFAGIGKKGYSGDGGPAAQAKLSEPASLALGEQGNLYVADSGNDVIRMITPDGRISTIAGNGEYGTDGEAVDATQARLAIPAAIALGRDGSVYIAEQWGHRVRRVSPEGIITTLAGTGEPGFSGDGGLGLNARLANPRALAVATDGTILVADADNNRIRRIRPVRPAGTPDAILVPAPGGDVVFEFDSRGRHQRTIDALTGITLASFTYDEDNKLLRVTDRDGNEIQIERPAADQVQIISPDSHTTTLHLDTDGWVERIVDPASEEHLITYEAGGLIDTFTDPRGNRSSYEYDTRGRLTKAWPRGTDPATDPPTTLTRSEVTGGFEVALETPMGRTTTYRLTQDADGTLHRTVTDPTGVVHAEERRPDGTMILTVDGNPLTQTLAPDPRWGMAAPLATSATYTAPGRDEIAATVDTQIALNNNDPLDVASRTDTYTIGARTWTRNYDKTTATITTTTPEGRQTIVTMDGLGRVASEQIGDLEPTSYGYDTRGRLTTITGGSGADARTTSIDYKGVEGWVDQITDPEARVTSFTDYDPAGRVEGVTGPAGATSAGYDANGNLTSLAPPGRPAYGFGASVEDQLDRYTLPTVGGVTPETTFTFNDDRQYQGATLPGNEQIVFDYDLATGRLDQVTRTPDGGAAHTIDFAYDANGRLDSVTAPGSVVFTVGYTSGLPTSATWSGPVAGSVSVTLDDELRVTSETVADTPAVAFSYDDDGLLTSVGALTLSRDTQTGLLDATSIADVSTTIGRNGFGEPTALTTTADTSTLYDVQVTQRDKLGRIVGRSETIGGTTTDYSYEYWPDGRLKRILADSVEVAAYTYDAAGNLLAAGGSAADFDDQDQILAWEDLTFTHTALGERASSTDASTSDQTIYQWTAGRLTGVDLPDSTEVRYVIDGAGRRIGRKVDGTLTRGYLWSGEQIVAELDAAGDVVSRFVYGSRAHVPDLIIKDTDTYRVVTDERGSPRLIVDTSDGSIVQRLDYSPWGEITADTNPGFQPFAFAGGLWDPEAGLVLFGARVYDPATGRWLSRDPVGFSGGANHYAYADGDPINQIDPSGLSAIGCFQDLLGLAGMIPIIGGVFDLVNAAIYAARGNWGYAALALAAAVLGVSIYMLRGGARVGRPVPRAAPGAGVADDVIRIKPGSAGGPTAGKPFPRSVRDATLAENPGTCVYCRMETTTPQVDHAIPRVRGGNATIDNAQTTCPWCNASKGPRDAPVNPPPGYRGSWPPLWWDL